MKALGAIYCDINDARNEFKKLTILARKEHESKQSLYPKYKKAFLLGLVLPALQQLTGINAVCFYAPIIFSVQPNSQDLPMLLSIFQVISAFCTIFIVNRFKRKTLFLAGAVVCSIGHEKESQFVNLTKDKKGTKSQGLFSRVFLCGS